MKKFLTLILAVILALGCISGLTACGGVNKEDLKVGFIFLHNEDSSYDKNFIDAAEKACEALELDMDKQVFMKTNIPETEECYTAAVELVQEGCNIVFADSFGHEAFLLQAAKEFPDVQFCHATGTTAHTEKLSNFHNAFASIYEGRYLAGVAAGLKINEMITAGNVKIVDENDPTGTSKVTLTAANAKMGYVGAYTYAEVISGYTSFYLGAKSVCPTIKMDVQFTGSWYDLDKEQAAAETLISKGCCLLSGHADSMGCPNACQTAGIPNVFYNGTNSLSTFLISSRINWEPYFKYIINSVIEGEEMPADYVGTMANGAVEVFAPNTALAAANTVDTLANVKANILNGSLKIFDCSKFTVGGQTKSSYLADVDTDKDYTPDTEVISGGIFQESKFRSAPYFDLRIDGITLLNAKY